jgi:hypothetical protein
VRVVSGLLVEATEAHIGMSVEVTFIESDGVRLHAFVPSSETGVQR